MKSYIIHKTNRKTIALVINNEGELIVKAPLNISNKEIEKVINKKRKWIQDKQYLMNCKKDLYKTCNFLEGEELLYLGMRYPVKYSNDIKEITVIKNEFNISKKISDKKAAVVKWYKKAALIFINQRVSEYEKITGLKTKSIKITSARQRWGSCGRERNINFSWRLVMCPIEIIDYVVLHEIAHIVHPNHSKHFYNYIQKIMPDYKVYKKWLADNQRIMDLI